MMNNYIVFLSFFCLILCFPSSFHAQNSLNLHTKMHKPNIKLPLKAASLGNWLVTEGWMNTSRFDGIINKDLLDGTQVQFMSTKLNKYLSAENGGGTILVANNSSASDWETFRLWRVNESYFNLRVFTKQFVGLRSEGVDVAAVANEPTDSETFAIMRNDGHPNRVRLRAPNGLFLQAQSETLVTADYSGSSWDDNDPSVFNMTILGGLQGEFQITNGYGDKAPKVMRDHWDSYITEDDFRFMSANGVEAVRIPVGWWIAYDPNPPKPFIGGSSQVLDRAFRWAEKYGIKVIVDLHAIRVSQNGYPHSGCRDGYQEWGVRNIAETVQVIEFLAKRYAKSPSLAAIELMNEPLAPGLPLDALKMYYMAGYFAVRRHTRKAYVILSNRLNTQDPKELFSLARHLHRVAIDVHYYNLFWDGYKKMSVQENIDHIYNNRASDIRNLTSAASRHGPLVFVGEWVGDFDSRETPSKEDYQRFVEAQLQVYGRATFGWAYWAFKSKQNLWNLRWMIENDYMKL